MEIREGEGKQIDKKLSSLRQTGQHHDDQGGVPREDRDWVEQGKDCDLEILTCLLSVQHSLEQSLPAADLKVMLDSVVTFTF